VAAVLRLARLGDLIGNYPPDTLDRGFSFEDFAAVNEAMAEMYGPHGARGLCLRAGRAMLRSAVTEGGLMADLPDPAFSLLPAGAKVKVGLNTMADVLSKLSDQEARLEERGDELVFVIEKCPECWGRTSESAICHAHTGMLLEALHWLVGSEEYDATEVECIAGGDGACTFLVTRKSEEQVPPQDKEEESSGTDGDGGTEAPVG
jgi:predicted hydrocarbon binding protein